MMHVDEKDHVQVVIRVRPLLDHEISGITDGTYSNAVRIGSDNDIALQMLDSSNALSTHSYVFDHIYGPQSSQRELYETTAKSVVQSCLEGYNATIFAYGQTGTGKTYTMEGEGAGFENRGIIPRAIEQIFTHIQEKATVSNRFLVRASYLQIYNDCIYDLLSNNDKILTIREEDKSKINSKGIYVDGLSEYVVRSPQEVFKLMATGTSYRATGKTKLNEVSSRSHAVLKVIVEQCETSFVNANGDEISVDEFEELIRTNSLGGKSPEELVRQKFRVAKLNLVDLAGSERLRKSDAQGVRLRETTQINKSLSALGNVIAALTDHTKKHHIPYRDSKLTRLLEDSLGGNCRTTMIAMVSPSGESAAESLSTLKFAHRAKNIRNFAHINEDLDKNSLLRKYQRELEKLRRELNERSKNVVDHRVILELEDQKRRAEADKVAALRALESRSLEFMKEKAEKKRLEEKIAALECQMVVGGPQLSMHELPQFKLALNATRDKIRAQYKEKMIDLEKEREQIEFQKAQVDRYKQLMLKQRDIMVALTQRLNERDDQIVTLQDELYLTIEARDTLQEKLDEKNAELIHIERLQAENVPHNNEPSSPNALEERVAMLTNQYRGFREEMTSKLNRKDEEVNRLRQENDALNEQLSGTTNTHITDASPSSNSVELETLRTRTLNYEKEQIALKTIMEKINLLALNISSSLPENTSAPVEKQIRSLCQVASAAVQALRN